MKKSELPFLVPGFRFSALHCGIKKEKLLDLGLVISETPAWAAGTFTRNRIKAAPVLISQKRIRSGTAQALLVNSGNANACNGRQGIIDAQLISRTLSTLLKIPEQKILLASTGIIGKPLPRKKIQNALPHLVEELHPDNANKFAQSIMTTDHFPKTIYLQQNLNHKKFTILGMCKGAGMIMPQMATMLAFIFTDLYLPLSILKPIFHTAVNESFNRISVDGETSTNDTAICLANGWAGNSSPHGKSLIQIESLFIKVLKQLAELIIKDGEGATKIVEINVWGARSKRDADLACRAVANSPLVKTALHGCEPNWGRIISALGKSGACLNPDRIDIDFNSVPIVRSSRGLPGVNQKAKAILKKQRFKININLHHGKNSASILTCDLSPQYVQINSGYMT